MFDAAVVAAHPSAVLPRWLPELPTGCLIVLGAGKAAGAMAEAVEHHYFGKLKVSPDRLQGLFVTRHGYGVETRHVRIVEAGHPVPDVHSLAAAAEALELAEAAGPDDLVLVLLSGGGSANWVAPVAGLTLEAKQALTRALLKSGASIPATSIRFESICRGSRAAALPARPCPRA
jgi:hydroxypyruvate reductase